MSRIHTWSKFVVQVFRGAVLTASILLQPSNAVQAEDLKGPEVVVVHPEAVASMERHTVVDVPAVMHVLGPKDATAAGKIVFSGQEDPLRVGVASYDRVELLLENWPFDEVMFFLEGRLEITSASGVKTSVKAGDVIVVPKGFNGTWRQLEPIRKISVIYDGKGYYAKK